MEIVDKLYRNENGNLFRTKQEGYTLVEEKECQGWKIDSKSEDRVEAIQLLSPSGLRVDIERKNLISLLSKVTVINGVIQETCGVVLVYSSLILEPISTEAYQNALLDNQLRIDLSKTTFKAKEVEPRSVISILQNRRIRDYVYAGNLDVLVGFFHNQRCNIVDDVKRHVFLRLNDDESISEIMYLTSWPKVVDVKGKSALFISDSIMLNFVNDRIKKNMLSRLISFKSLVGEIYHYIFQKYTFKNYQDRPLMVNNDNSSKQYKINRYISDLADDIIYEGSNNV